MRHARVVLSPGLCYGASNVAADAALTEEAAAFGCRLPAEELVAVFATDLELNAQGLDVWLESAAP